MKKLTTALVVLFLATVTFAGEWIIETVDDRHVSDGSISLALDSNNYPHIAYNVSSRLKYAKWNGEEWILESVNNEQYVDDYTISLALDSNDKPHIAYQISGTNNSLMYAFKNDDNWINEEVDSFYATDNKYNSIALDTQNIPYIAYYRYLSYGLCLAVKTGDVWEIEYITANYTLGISSKIDINNNPHISYGKLRCLYYTYFDGLDWMTQIVDGNGVTDQVFLTSLTLSSESVPHITYDIWRGDLDRKELNYAYYNTEHSWVVEFIIDDGSLFYPSIALDSGDSPHISFTTDGLYYTSKNGDSWQIECVDSTGRDSSLALDNFDNPHISYRSNYSLKYAYWDPGTGVEDAELSTNVSDEGVLINWAITGDAPASFSVLRSVGNDEPVAISGSLPGTAARWLDTGAYDASGKGLKPLVYWLETTDADGTVSRFGPTEAVSFPGAARVLDLAVYPSPASGSFTVDYTLPEDGRISISLYDLSGRRVSTVFDGETTAGRHEFSCDAAALPPGVYLARLATDSGSLTQRLVIAR